MDIIGTFYNEKKGITITFKNDGSYTLRGLEGYNTEYGAYRFFKKIKYSEFTDMLELKHSTRLEDILSSGTYTFPITVLNPNSFSTIADGFIDMDFNGNRIPSIFTKVK